MDIDNILNQKGHAAAAAHAEAQLRQQLQQAASNQMNMQTDSEIGSDQSSNSSLKQPLHHMSNYPNSLPYSSGPQQQGSQMMSNGFISGEPQEDGYVQSGDSNAGRPNEGAPKAFACSTCAKRFARRSDLARHGKLLSHMIIEWQLTGLRTHTQWSETSYVRLAWLWETVHSAIGVNGTRTRAYRREASHV